MHLHSFGAYARPEQAFGQDNASFLTGAHAPSKPLGSVYQKGTASAD
jgi:hypothetical protein